MSLELHTQSFRLENKKIWVSYGGAKDPIVSEASFAELVAAFRDRGAAVMVVDTPYGHQISMDEVQNAREWLKE